MAKQPHLVASQHHVEDSLHYWIVSSRGLLTAANATEVQRHVSCQRERSKSHRQRLFAIASHVRSLPLSTNSSNIAKRLPTLLLANQTSSQRDFSCHEATSDRKEHILLSTHPLTVTSTRYILPFVFTSCDASALIFGIIWIIFL